MFYESFVVVKATETNKTVQYAVLRITKVDSFVSIRHRGSEIDPLISEFGPCYCKAGLPGLAFCTVPKTRTDLGVFDDLRFKIPIVFSNSLNLLLVRNHQAEIIAKRRI